MGTTYVFPLATVRLEILSVEEGGGGGPVDMEICFSVDGELSFPDVSNAVAINP